MTCMARSVARGRAGELRAARPAGTRALAALAGMLAGAGSGCELREVTVAQPEDIVVAEVVLVAGAGMQRAVLHRTHGSGLPPGEVEGAEVVITGPGGRMLRLRENRQSLCFVDLDEEGRSTAGTCYVAETSLRPFVVPGERYALEVRLPDGRVLTGATTVPDAFEMRIRPNTTCALLPGSTLELVWTSSPGAWVYAAETELRGLAAALERRGIELAHDPLRLFGLSVSRTDTTIVFPTEFGLFDRFDPDLTEALAAIQQGLPPDVEADIVIAAADRNYVGWERGGSFNPSGFVRVPSVFGDGTGVFGSIVPQLFGVSTAAQSGLPPCG